MHQACRETKEAAGYKVTPVILDHWSNQRCMALTRFGRPAKGDPNEFKGDFILIFIHSTKLPVRSLCNTGLCKIFAIATTSTYSFKMLPRRIFLVATTT